MVQRRSAEAELVSAAREWSVLKLGSLLLGTAIERQRTSQQDPLMLRAGQLFATITGGSFSGLGQEFDDEDVPKLIGRRPTEDYVHVAAMSEGARDQLYLALRLAYLRASTGGWRKLSWSQAFTTKSFRRTSVILD